MHFGIRLFKGFRGCFVFNHWYVGVRKKFTVLVEMRRVVEVCMVNIGEKRAIQGVIGECTTSAISSITMRNVDVFSEAV